MNLRVLLLVLLCLIAPAAMADTQAVAPADLPGTVAASAAQLKQLADQRDQIVQQAATASSDTQLVALDTSAQQLSDDVATYTDGPLQSAFAQLKIQLDMVGPTPASGAVPDLPPVTAQRLSLARLRTQLEDEAAQAKGITDSLTKLHNRIQHLQHERLKDQLAFRSNSILGLAFWAPLLNPDPTDHDRLNDFYSQLGAQAQSAWVAGQWQVTLLLVVLGLAIWLALPRAAEKAGVWFCQNRLPDGRLRRSTMALITTVASIFAMFCLAQCLDGALTHHQALSPTLQTLSDKLIKLALTCAAIAGLGRALLSTHHASWRMPVIADEVANAISPFPKILAALLMLSGTIEQINRAADTSLQVTLFGRGLVALVVAVTIGGAMVQANRVRNRLAAAGQAPEARSTQTALVHAAILLTAVASLLALVGGYITIGRYFTYELVWFMLVLCVFYLIKQLAQDVLEAVLSPRHTSGKTLMRLFNVSDTRLDQASIVLTAAAGTVLLLAAVMALLTGGVGTTPTDLVASILNLFGAEKLRSVNLNPAHLLNGLVTLVAGIYVLRVTHQWLDKKFLPKTSMGAGMRASLMTLFINIGYVVVVLFALSALGVQWNSLAWIVSALSVGIGFGLQEIVKNFVSGLILLTERPVKVGDIVSLSGIEGDIRRINVRATEIQLGDRSTVIVPNSQLISQNVRNVTMGNRSLGVVSLSFVFPLDIDPEQVRNLLLNIFKQHDGILEQPGPSVSFSQLSRDGITLAVSGNVRSPRVADGVKSDLLFEILKQLRAAGISLATQQVIQIQRAPQAEGQ